MQADRHKCRTAPTRISDKLLTTFATAEAALARGTSSLTNWSAPRTTPGTLVPERWPCGHHRRHADAPSPSRPYWPNSQWSRRQYTMAALAGLPATCGLRQPGGRCKVKGGGVVFIAFAIITGTVLAILTWHRWRSLRVISRQVRSAETEKQRNLPMRAGGIGDRPRTTGEQRPHKLAACCRAGEMSDAESHAVGYPLSSAPAARPPIDSSTSGTCPQVPQARVS